MVSVFGEKISNAVSKYLASIEYKVISLASCDNGIIVGNVCDFAPKASSVLKFRTVIRITSHAYSSPSVYGIVSVSKIENNYPNLLTSFQVDQSQFEQQIVNGISTCLVASGTCGPSLISLLQMDDIRRIILAHMRPKDLAILSCVSKSLDSISKKHDVDETFWKHHLKKDFNLVAERFCNRKSYYKEAKTRKEKELLDRQNNSEQSRLLVNEPGSYNPGFPRPRPYHPDHHPDPYFPDPLNPVGPFFPNPSGGGRFPAPWDRNSSEMLPSRPPRHQGPRQLGGSNSNPFDHFGNNDFI